MTYTVTTTSGTTVATVADNTVNRTATSLTLIGKNYPGYGIFLNENYVRLLENFSNIISPTNPLSGQLWWDSSSKTLNVWDGVSWRPVSSVQATDTDINIDTRQVGDLWWDLNVKQLKAWDGEVWVIIGPIDMTTEEGETGVKATFISDGFVDHPVVVFYIRNNWLAIISEDTEFVPVPQIIGFNSIKPGINLINSTIPSGSVSAKYAGLAEKAELLGSSSETSFLRRDQDSESIYTVTVNKLKVNTNFEIDASSTRTRLNNFGTTGNVEVWVGSQASTRAVSISSSGELKLDAMALGLNQGGTGARTAEQARINLGLDNMAAQRSNAVVITGGNISNANLINAKITSLQSALPILFGGTGATTAAAARTNLGAAPIASPAFTGTPTAPTPSAGDNSTKLATTAFVKSVMPAAYTPPTKIYAGVMSAATVQATYTGVAVNTEISFIEQRVYSVGTGNGGATIYDYYRMVLRRTSGGWQYI